MAKRTIPQFIIDTTRNHNCGECDFITCTDVNNGFIARVDILSPTEIAAQQPDNINVRIVINIVSHYGAKIEIIRDLGENPTPTQRRALLKKAGDMYMDRTTNAIPEDGPTVENQIKFLDTLILGGRQELAEAGSDYDRSQTVTMSVAMLMTIKKELEKIGKK